MLIVFLFICLAAGGLAGFLTASGVREWYPHLRKPPGTPPGWVFGPVWTTLYVLDGRRGVAGVARVRLDWRALRAVHLLRPTGLNMAWSGIFFGARMPGVAFAEIVVLWLAILFNIVIFHWLTPRRLYCWFLTCCG